MASSRYAQGQLLTSTAFPTDAGPRLGYKYKTIRRSTSRHQIKRVRSLVVDSIAYAFNAIPTDQQDSPGLAGVEPGIRPYNSLATRLVPLNGTT
jgi:hypothetical protein